MRARVDPPSIVNAAYFVAYTRGCSKDFIDHGNE